MKSSTRTPVNYLIGHPVPRENNPPQETVMITRSEMTSKIDHTLLRVNATAEEVATTVRQAAELGAASACISPSQVANAPRDAVLCTVVGFPSGAHSAAVKAFETAQAVADGAEEIDMVVNLGAIAAGDWDTVANEVAAVRAACEGKVLKIILETAALDDDQIRRAGQIAIDNGVDFLKTSTGFHANGDATVHTVSLLAELASNAGRPIGVKASGGIRDTETALAMLEAGATRIGASATEAILAGLE